MFNTFAADLAAQRQDEIEATIGTDWAVREAYGIRYLSESDFPIAEAVNDDWDAYLEMSYVDPAERHW